MSRDFASFSTSNSPMFTPVSSISLASSLTISPLGELGRPILGNPTFVPFLFLFDILKCLFSFFDRVFLGRPQLLLRFRVLSSFKIDG